MEKTTQATPDQAIMRPFTFEHLPIRGRLLRIKNITSQINTLSQGEDMIASILAEMLSACIVLAHDMKDKANITLQITSQGNLPVLLAKCNYKGVLRAFAKKEGDVQKTNAPITQETDSTFTITVDYGRNEQSYQSIIPINTSSVSQTIETHFEQSSNLPTLFKVFTQADANGNTSCGALFLQGIAGQKTVPADDWRRMKLLVSTLHPHEVLPGDVKEIELLSRLFAEDDVRVFPKQHLTFAETSNRERMLEALKSIGIEECAVLLAEEKGQLKMTDEYTGQSEIFTEEDMRNIFGEQWQK